MSQHDFHLAVIFFIAGDDAGLLSEMLDLYSRSAVTV